jgi:hypothetical protein
MSLDITEIPETELQPEEVEEEEVAPIEEEVADIEETPVPKKRGRPVGAKNKPKPKPREIPMNTPEPQVDMHALTNMLAQHLASEKAQARERRQANWSGFF